MPPGQEELLLKAALMDLPESRIAWETWIRSTDVSQINYGSQCLLPLVTSNLREKGVSHPALTKFKGIYRQTWYRNQMHMTELASVVQILQAKGIETMALKGAALLVQFYKDYGLRVLGDIDLLVKPQDFYLAIQTLLKLGWVPENFENLNDISLTYIREVHFFKESGVALDLHSHILFENIKPDAESDFWNEAQPITIRDQQTYTLNLTDQLLHLCVHGLKWSTTPSLRWIADSILLLRSESFIDWNRIIDQSTKWNVMMTMKVALQYLANQMNAPIPGEILTHFDQTPIRDEDHKQYQIYNFPRKLPTSLQRRYFVYSNYYAREKAFLPRLWGFLHFLQHSWGVKHFWWMPFYLISKSFLQLWQVIALFISRKNIQKNR